MKLEAVAEEVPIKTLKTEGVIPGFQRALTLFKQASTNVPAYKAFLKSHGVDPKKINTPADFSQVPIVTKENYLKKYPLQDLMWQRRVSDARMISASSGSSGQPFFWPRGNQSVEDSVIILDELLDKTFRTRKRETLCINAFAMGTWIAGTYMNSAMWRLADLGHKIVTITPGITKEEIARELEVLGPRFSQVLIMGYPPFVKDVVDYARTRNIKLPRLDVMCLFAGENFSEQWRDYILTRIGKKNKPESTLGIYGTADAGIVGIESPLSIHIRRLSAKDRRLFEVLFGRNTILPTLVQYNPDLRYVEEVDGKIIFTTDNSLPLIRYEILDEGRVYTPEMVAGALNQFGIKIPSKLESFSENPYIALFGRQDVAATFYALNIYPENIKYGLELPSLQGLVTGKFTIKADFDITTQEQVLNLSVELQPAVKPDQKIERKVFKAVVDNLMQNNSEYNKLHQEIGKKAEPVVHLMEQGDPDFKPGIKHRWIKKG
jgi:phenylacetate-CoA ligase